MPHSALDADPVLLPPSILLSPQESVRLPFRRKKPGDPFAPKGLDWGGFRVYPTLGIGATYSTNARRSATHKEDALGVNLRPELRIVSDWSRHAWETQFSGDFIKYFRGNIATPIDVAVSSHGRLDIRRTTHADFESGYSYDRTSPENSEGPNNAKQDWRSHHGRLGAALYHEAGPVELRLRMGVSRDMYGNVKLEGGGVEHNKDRNVTTPSTSLRITYIDPPIIQPFVQAEFATRIHDKRRDDNGHHLDTHDISFKLGFDVHDDPFWEGDIALAYIRRHFKDDSFKTEHNLGVDARLRWSPTRLTSFFLTLSTGLMNTSNAESQSGKTHRVELNMTRAVRDNIRALVAGDLTLDKPEGSRYDKTYHAKLGLEWDINRSLSWAASYDGTWYKSAYHHHNSYNEQRFTAGIILRR